MLNVPYYRQHRDYTCGPVCLRMVLAYYGHETDEVSLTMLCRTNVFGTGLDDIATAAQSLGFEAEWARHKRLSDLRAAVEQGIPPIVMIDVASVHGFDVPHPIGHLVVIIAADSSTITYHDPELGPGLASPVDIFMQAWEVFAKGVVWIWLRT